MHIRLLCLVFVIGVLSLDSPQIPTGSSMLMYHGIGDPDLALWVALQICRIFKSFFG
jgi:hypothetical protein